MGSFIGALPIRRGGQLTKVGLHEADRLARIVANIVRHKRNVQGPIDIEPFVPLAREGLLRGICSSQIPQFIAGRVDAGEVAIEL